MHGTHLDQYMNTLPYHMYRGASPNDSRMMKIAEQYRNTSEADHLTRLFLDTRRRTVDIVRNLEPDDFIVQTAPYTSPPKWHMGHVSWLFEIVMSKIDKSYTPYSDKFATYLNSYYNQFGIPHQKDRRGTVSRPTLQQMQEYYEKITQTTVEFLKTHQGKSRLIEMAIHHECQHQELMIYDIQHLLANLYEPARCQKPPRPTKDADPSMIHIRGGIYHTGYAGDGFCYDVELPEHKVYLNDYTIAKLPVSCGEYLEFMESGGYTDFRYWLDDGWKNVQKNGWDSPMYWESINDTWYVKDFAGLRKVNPAEPVVHISYYEADAYARWAGARLPTEHEWEKAACWDEASSSKRLFPWGNDPPAPDKCNLLESESYQVSELGSYPKGASSYGCQQLIGDVWEWTASEFVGYPGFQSTFQEYNDKWFTGQKVLRGGSFGTPAVSIRSSYRNFFHMDERWLISGFRLAN